MNRTLLGISTAAIGLLVVIAGCRPPQKAGTGPTPAPAPLAVKATTVKHADISSNLTYTGNVQGQAQVSLMPQVSGRIEKLNVDIGSVVKAGDVIAELDKSTYAAQVAQAQAGVEVANAHLAQIQAGARVESVAAARANARAAQDKVAQLQAGPRAESVAQAKANLDAANAKLAQLKAGPTQQQIAVAKLVIEQAKDSLYAAQQSKDAACGHGGGGVCNAAQAQAFAASTAVDQANAQLKILTSPPTKDVVDQAQAAIDAANEQYKLAQAPYTAQDIAQAQAAADAASEQAKLAAKPYTAEDRKSAQASVDQAQATVNLAKIQLDETVIHAPVDGIVTAKLLDVGAMASPATPILTLQSKTVEVDVSVEEQRLGLVVPGEAATLTVSAYPGQTFDAKIIGSPPTIDPKSRTALVRLAPVDPSGKLKPGMFAQVILPGPRATNALVVSNAAIVTVNGQTFLDVITGGAVNRVRVATGLSDSSNVQIISGAQAGQQVVLDAPATLQDGTHVTATVQ